ncbi:MAG: hypothetical protein AAFV49_13145 [Pseudomonadota bacterium]
MGKLHQTANGSSPARIAFNIVDRLGWRLNFDRTEHLSVDVRTHRHASSLGRGRILDALTLLSCNDPGKIALLNEHLPGGLVIDIGEYSVAWYDRDKRACFINNEFAAHETPERLALAIIHELTHARLEAAGIRYDEGLRARIERVCVYQERRFARTLFRNGQVGEDLVTQTEARLTAIDDISVSDALLNKLQQQAVLRRAFFLGRRLPQTLRWAFLKIVQWRPRRLRAPTRTSFDEG